jgi:prepilin-type processing-associated H-X9-DG protein
LLVVIAIIGVLVALLLPAIQAAREAARRSSCGNNLKQIGLGIANYTDARKILPCATISNVGWSVWNGTHGPTWVVAILPFMEGTNVLSLYNKNAYWIDSPMNVSFRSASLPFMQCPSDGYVKILATGQWMTSITGAANGTVGTGNGTWARGNYGANASPKYETRDAMTNSATSSASAWADLMGRGVMWANTGLTLNLITDGTSKTIAVAEMRADPDPATVRGTWGHDGGCILFGHGCNATQWTTNKECNSAVWSLDIGPNNPGGVSGGNFASGDINVATTQNVSQATLLTMGMFACNSATESVMGPKSQHPGGLQYVFCDGSVHWMDDSIQVGTPPATSGGGSGQNGTLGYYEMLFLAADGNNVPQEVYNGN